MYKKNIVLVTKCPSSFLSKSLLIMKLSLIIILATLLQVNAAAQKINLKRENTTLEDVFKLIRKQSGYNIFYNSEMLKGTGMISVNFINAPLEEAMKKCLEGKNLSFKIVQKNII